MFAEAGSVENDARMLAEELRELRELAGTKVGCRLLIFVLYGASDSKFLAASFELLRSC